MKIVKIISWERFFGKSMASTIDSFEENFEKKKEMKKKIPVIL